MNRKNQDPASDPTLMGNDRPRREPEGREGAGAHQEGRHARDAGHGDRDNRTGEKWDSDVKRAGPQPGGQKSSGSSDQATHGPDDRHGEDRDTM